MSLQLAQDVSRAMLKRLWDTGDRSDVTIRFNDDYFGEQDIRAHKSILCAASPVLADMLSDRDEVWLDDQWHDFKAMLRPLYGVEVEAVRDSWDHVIEDFRSLYLTASKYEIEAVRDWAENGFIQKLAETSADTSEAARERVYNASLLLELEYPATDRMLSATFEALAKHYVTERATAKDKHWYWLYKQTDVLKAFLLWLLKDHPKKDITDYGNHQKNAILAASVLALAHMDEEGWEVLLASEDLCKALVVYLGENSSKIRE